MTKSNKVEKIDLAKYTDGKKFSDGEHEILALENGGKIFMRFKKNKPTQMRYTSRESKGVTLNLQGITERKRVARRTTMFCLVNIHNETADWGGHCTRYIYSSKFTLLGEDYLVGWLCVTENCGNY